MNSLELLTERVNCNLCGNNNRWGKLFSARDRSLHTKGLWDILQCKGCGLVSLNPRLTKEELKKHYKQNYTDPRTNWISKLLYVLGGFQKRFIKRIPLKKNGHLLDIGCGIDPFLSIQKSRGYYVYGVDLDEKVIDFLKSVGIEGKHGELIDANLEKDYFDIITFWHSLEHVLDPLQTLEESKIILKKNGWLIINLPNFDSLERHIFQEEWSYLAPPRHLYHFTPVTLSRMLKKVGFKVIKIKYPFFNPQLWIGSITNIFQKKFSFKMSYVYRTMITLALFPIFLPINIIVSIIGKSSIMEFQAEIVNDI